MGEDNLEQLSSDPLDEALRKLRRISGEEVDLRPITPEVATRAEELHLRLMKRMDELTDEKSLES